MTSAHQTWLWRIGVLTSSMTIWDPRYNIVWYTFKNVNFWYYLCSWPYLGQSMNLLQKKCWDMSDIQGIHCVLVCEQLDMQRLSIKWLPNCYNIIWTVRNWSCSIFSKLVLIFQNVLLLLMEQLHYYDPKKE